MFITPHTSVAIWISTKINDPILAFILGVVSHFILDIIPHGDENFASHISTRRQIVIFYVKLAFIDLVLASGLLYFFVIHGPEVNYYVLTAAVLGAWLPDFLWMLIDYFNFSKFHWYVIYHERIHNLIGWKYSIIYGLPFQIVFTLSMLKMSF